MACTMDVVMCCVNVCVSVGVNVWVCVGEGETKEQLRRRSVPDLGSRTKMLQMILLRPAARESPQHRLPDELGYLGKFPSRLRG